MSDETPITSGDGPDPISDTPPEPGPGAPEPTRAGAIAARDVALGAIAFVAVLALLLGATRLIERGGAPGPSASDAAAPAPSATSTPAETASPVPTASPVSTASPSASAQPTGSVGPTPSVPSSPSAGDPVLVGAGDIATCASTNDDDTAALLDGIEGTVFTAGDNAYESGPAEQFRD